jgi:hypothetical protein
MKKNIFFVTLLYWVSPNVRALFSAQKQPAFYFVKKAIGYLSSHSALLWLLAVLKIAALLPGMFLIYQTTKQKCQPKPYWVNAGEPSRFFANTRQCHDQLLDGQKNCLTLEILFYDTAFFS